MADPVDPDYYVDLDSVAGGRTGSSTEPWNSLTEFQSGVGTDEHDRTAATGENSTINCWIKGDATLSTYHLAMTGWTTEAGNHVKFAVWPGSEGDGTEGSAPALITTGGDHIFKTQAGEYIDLFGIELAQTGGSSLECVRCNHASSGTNIHIKDCLFRGTGGNNQGDGVYCAGDAEMITVENSVFYNFGRACMHAQIYATGPYVQNWYIDSCFGDAGDNENDNQGGFIAAKAIGSGDEVNYEVHNCYAGGTPQGATVACYDQAMDSGDVDWGDGTSSYNAGEDTSCQVRFGSSNNNVDSVTMTDTLSQASGDYYGVASISGRDYTTGAITGGATDHGIDAGATTLSTSINGVSRPQDTDDRGPFELEVGGGGLSIPVAMRSYRNRRT